jgi:hypothetical protein
MNFQADCRVMQVSELQTVLSWASIEGWNPGTFDAEAFHRADPHGHFVTIVDGQAVAAVSVVKHDPDNAFLGLYICRPEWRGKGLGLATWQFGISRAASRSIGLDGVPEQESNYSISNFVKTGSTLRHEGRTEAKKSRHVRPVRWDDVEHLINMDGCANGFSRPRFMKSWLNPEVTERGTQVMQREGEICGFATWRSCENGTKIGPIIATELSTALELISDIAVLRPNGPLVVDVPERNVALTRELANCGFTVPFVTARMYRGKVPENTGTLQAIATMELG